MADSDTFFAFTLNDNGTPLFGGLWPHEADGTVDMVMSDGAAAWTAFGLKDAALRGPFGSPYPFSLTNLFVGLAGLERGVSFTRSVEPGRHGSKIVVVEWQGGGGGEVVRASLARAEPAQPMVAFLLDHLTRNVTSLQEGQLAAYELAVQAAGGSGGGAAGISGGGRNAPDSGSGTRRAADAGATSSAAATDHFAGCGKAAEPGSRLKRCGGCKKVRYCNTACQRNHWIQGHKQECRGLREEEA